MRPTITLVHRRRNSGEGGLLSSTSSSTSSTPITTSSVFTVKRPHPYRWNSVKRASSSLAESSHRSREERACARRRHRTSCSTNSTSPQQLSPICSVSVSVPPSPAFSDSSSASVDLRSESFIPDNLSKPPLTYAPFYVSPQNRLIFRFRSSNKTWRPPWSRSTGLRIILNLIFDFRLSRIISLSHTSVVIPTAYCVIRELTANIQFVISSLSYPPDSHSQPSPTTSFLRDALPNSSRDDDTRDLGPYRPR